MHTAVAASSRTVTSPARPRLRVTVLRGGPSAERDVSLASGAAVADALRRRGHDVFEADIDPDDLSALDHPADVIFPALHGRFGEDGTLQYVMETRRLRFVGSDAPASHKAMDKVTTKRIALAAGIQSPPFEVIERRPQSPAATALPLPVIVKPTREGSSVATTIARTATEFAPAVECVFAAGVGPALIETFITGDELTIGVLDDCTLPPICIRPRQGFYDYHAKYQADDTEYLFDAHPAALLAEAGRLSRLIFQRLGCRHLGRVDWMVDRNGGLWFLEVNTLPGFTSHSLLPKAAARAGIPFDELVERLVYTAAAGTQ